MFVECVLKQGFLLGYLKLLDNTLHDEFIFYLEPKLLGCDREIETVRLLFPKFARCNWTNNILELRVCDTDCHRHHNTLDDPIMAFIEENTEVFVFFIQRHGCKL